METEGLTDPDPPPECQEPKGRAASSNATSPRGRASLKPPPEGGASKASAGANVRAATPRVNLLGSRTGAQYLLAAPAPPHARAVGGLRASHLENHECPPSFRFVGKTRRLSTT